MKIKFYETADDALLKFAVIIARHSGKWVLCKHKDRTTYEIPGGHREPGETIEETAERELREETGALQYEITPICVYSVTGKNRVNETGEETCGMLFSAEIFTFTQQLHSEMERIAFFDAMPGELTYPQIQPALLKEYIRRTTHR